jgi:hypothetical protein
LPKKSLLEFATLTQGGSSYELDMPPLTPKVCFFFLFCVIWAASVRRLKSLPKSGFMLRTMKNITKDVTFGNQMLKTKCSVDDRLGLHIFVIFFALDIIYL